MHCERPVLIIPARFTTEASPLYTYSDRLLVTTLESINILQIKSMAPPAAFIEIPNSYESLDLTHVKVSHYPLGSPTATPVVVVTLNRPEKNNAFTPHMADSLELVFQTFHLDPRVKAIVLTGAGRMFCAGSDLEIGFSNEGRAVDFRDM